MIVVHKTHQFRKEFEQLPSDIQRRAQKQFLLLEQNPRHPSLRIKKMAGFRNIWEGRITRQYRFTFVVMGNVYRFEHIGPHDILKQP